MRKSQKILIIDDDPDFVEVTKIVLESGLYNVSSAPGPKEGLEKIAKENPDLIILDVMWPDKESGFELCRQLKKNEKFKNIPILMITAVDEKYGLGFKNVAGDTDWLPTDEFLSKPVDPVVLLQKVKKLLP